MLKANDTKSQPHAAGALSCAMMQNQGVGTQGKGFTLVRGAGHISARAATGSAHGAASLELECKQFCGKQLYSLSCLGGQSACVCVPEMLQCHFSLQYFSDPSKYQGAAPSPRSQQHLALGPALLLAPQLSRCLLGLVAVALSQGLALSPCGSYSFPTYIDASGTH